MDINAITTPFPFGEPVTLKQPVTVDGRTITQITLRAPKGRDWRMHGAKPEGAERTLALLVDLSQETAAVFDEMGMEDHAKFVGAAQGFFGSYTTEKELALLMLNSPAFVAGIQQSLKS